MLLSKQLLVAELLSIQAKSTDRPVEFVVGVGDHAKKESQYSFGRESRIENLPRLVENSLNGFLQPLAIGLLAGHEKLHGLLKRLFVGVPSFHQGKA